MLVRNVMEPAVKSVVAGKKAAAGRDACWCFLCEKDVTALALTNLPPLYWNASVGNGREPSVEGGRVEASLEAAARRVLRSPRHPALQPESFHGSVALRNYVLEAVVELVVGGCLEGGKCCGCERCITDTMAYTLNRYPSKYGVVWRGDSFLPHAQIELMSRELGQILGQASMVVARRPLHEMHHGGARNKSGG